MDIIREPDGVDFEVDIRPISQTEKNQISEVIAYYKKTGEVRRVVDQKSSKKKQKV